MRCRTLLAGVEQVRAALDQLETKRNALAARVAVGDLTALGALDQADAALAAGRRRLATAEALAEGCADAASTWSAVADVIAGK